MPQTSTTPDLQHYRAQHEALGAAHGEDALSPLRQRGLEHFLETGFPDSKDEAWRFTNLKPLASTAFERPAPNAALSPNRLAPYELPLGGPLFVFVDGVFRPELSELTPRPEGVRIGRFADADPAWLLEHLGRYAPPESDPFTALNTAFIEDGLFIEVEAGCDAGPPVHLVHVATGGQPPTMTHPRHLFVLGAGARLTVVEHYGGSGVTWSNAVSEAALGPRALMHHYFVERESEQAYNIASLHAEQAAGSRFESHTGLFGGALTRNNVEVTLAGERAHALVNGLFVGHGAQHMDNRMRLVHAAPHCDSRQFYKGVMDETAQGVFTGRIVVHPEGQQTDAKQTNRNLLLSGKAGVHAQPQLEIYADDVSCTHGATTGQIDEEALFYLRSRGLGEAAARSLLVFAFAGENLERMSLAPVRQLMHRLLVERLAGHEIRPALEATGDVPEAPAPRTGRPVTAGAPS